MVLYHAISRVYIYNKKKSAVYLSDGIFFFFFFFFFFLFLQDTRNEKPDYNIYHSLVQIQQTMILCFNLPNIQVSREK